MNNLKYLVLFLFLFSGCAGSGGDGDGQTNSNPDVQIQGDNNVVNVGTNTPDNAAEIIQAGNSDANIILGLTNCCKRAQSICVGNPNDGLEDLDCLLFEVQLCEDEFEEELQNNNISAFIEECAI
jgi:hypothetical protein